MYDVIVIGGGPMGSITSLLLARQGHDVLLLEKQQHPRWKPCGEGLSKEGADILESYRLLQPVRHLFSEIYVLTGGLAMILSTVCGSYM